MREDQQVGQAQEKHPWRCYRLDCGNLLIRKRRSVESGAAHDHQMVIRLHRVSDTLDRSIRIELVVTPTSGLEIFHHK